jgi:hypothetical protein
MRFALLLFVWIVGFESQAQSRFENVLIPKFKGNIMNDQCEPSIAIDPKDPNTMVAGSILKAYYFSENGGLTWTSKKMKSKFGVYGDPVLMFDTTGRVYYFHLSNYKKTTWLDRIVCQSAADVDKKFNQGTFPAPNGTKVQDKQWTVLNPFNNEIYMTWTQFDKYDSKDPMDSTIILFSKTSDQGKTWSPPLRISKFGGDCVDGDNTVEGAVPAVGPNGEIYVTWTGPNGLVFQKSLDGGKTWLKQEKLIQEHPGGWDLKIPGLYRANGLPILTCDLSNGPDRGTLYLNWCDQRNGETDTDVWIMRSRDGGETWSEPIRVNQDSSKKHQFFTWMSIDQSNGYLYFVYYDRRNYTDNKTDVYLSVSRDGGRTFKDHRISQTPFVPYDKVFFGDYNNIASVNGTIRPIWSRMDQGKISLYVGIVNEQDLFRLEGE